MNQKSGTYFQALECIICSFQLPIKFFILCFAHHSRKFNKTKVFKAMLSSTQYDFTFTDVSMYLRRHSDFGKTVVKSLETIINFILRFTSFSRT